MSNTQSEGQTINPKKYAKLAGWLYLSLIPLGIFGIIYIPETSIVKGDALATANNIVADQFKFRLSIISALLVQLVNLWLVIVLYKLLKPVNATVLAVMVVFVLVPVPVAMLNELNHLAVLMLLRTDYLSAFSADQLHALSFAFLNFHTMGVNIAQIFWGLWLFPMGWLVYKSGFLPKIIGIMLMIGSFGYFIDSFTYFLDPNFKYKLAEFLFWGEIMLPTWLVFKGVDLDKYLKVVEQTA